jgi:tetratricopeptide (TPR) repeat protein
MAQSIGYRTALSAGAILLGLAFAVPQAFAVEDMDDVSGSTKGGQAKSCPKGARYSEKKRGCVKASCGTGQVWSSGADACLDGNSASLTDDDLYLAGRDLGQEGHYAEALKLFFRIKNREQARVLGSIGYSTRKLGDVDKGIDYYHQALAIDPGYTKVREYLGEAYLQKGDVAKAKEQLMEIADRCGGPCDDYELLVNAIAAHVTGEKAVDWQF